MSRKNSNREFESEGVTCMTALKGISVKLNKVLVTGPGQGIILSIRAHHFQTLPRADNLANKISTRVRIMMTSQAMRFVALKK